MIERQIFTILKDGIDWFKADPRRIETFFVREHGLTAAEAANVRTYFEYNPAAGEQGGPPNVIHGYPRQVGPFPCYAILLDSDATKQRYLGDEAGTDTGYGDDAWEGEENLDGEPSTTMIHMVEDRISIHVCVENIPDVCLYYYHLLRWILLDSQADFHAEGFSNVQFSGRDLMPQEQYLPEHIWMRVISIQAEHDETAWEPMGRGTRVDGAFIGDGVTSDGVAKSITPYQEE